MAIGRSHLSGFVLSSYDGHGYIMKQILLTLMSLALLNCSPSKDELSSSIKNKLVENKVIFSGGKIDLLHQTNYVQDNVFIIRCLMSDINFEYLEKSFAIWIVENSEEAGYDMKELFEIQSMVTEHVPPDFNWEKVSIWSVSLDSGDAGLYIYHSQLSDYAIIRISYQ